jgi:hypothetical protein
MLIKSVTDLKFPFLETIRTTFVKKNNERKNVLAICWKRPISKLVKITTELCGSNSYASNVQYWNHFLGVGELDFVSAET